MRPGSVGALAVVALVLAGAVTAQPTCVEGLCVNAVDWDGDGVPDEAWVAAGLGYYGVSVIAGDHGVLGYWDTEGDESVDPHPVTAGFLWVFVEPHDDEVHVHEAGVAWEAYWHEHDTNEREPIAAVEVLAHDHDGDGVPEHAHVERLDLLP